MIAGGGAIGRRNIENYRGLYRDLVKYKVVERTTRLYFVIFNFDIESKVWVEK